jgi:hypothetical protein
MLFTVRFVKRGSELPSDSTLLCFRRIVISQDEYSYLEKAFPFVYTTGKLEGLSGWLEKHPKIVIDNFGPWVEKRFFLENEINKIRPTGLINRIDPNR